MLGRPGSQVQSNIVPDGKSGIGKGPWRSNSIRKGRWRSGLFAEGLWWSGQIKKGPWKLKLIEKCLIGRISLGRVLQCQISLRCGPWI